MYIVLLIYILKRGIRLIYYFYCNNCVTGTLSLLFQITVVNMLSFLDNTLFGNYMPSDQDDSDQPRFMYTTREY
jgi:hypothetical protein